MICLNLKSLITGKHKYQLIREKADYYEVALTRPMFGNFSGLRGTGASTIQVLAFNHRQAAIRAYWRGFRNDYSFSRHRCSKRFATYRVKKSISTAPFQALPVL